MGIDCGFDIYPPLEPTPSNQEKYKKFLIEVLRTYETDNDVCVEPEWEGVYIEFMVGEHPTIPYNCEHFLRFSSKVSGRSTARPYIDGVHNIAKKWLGDRVQFWDEMTETYDHRQWGRYDWNEIRAARKTMVEQAGKIKVHKEEVGTSSAAGVALLGKQEGKPKQDEEQKEESETKQEKDWVGDRLFAVKPIPGKGLGVIATSKIPKGTRLLSESPIFKVPRNMSNADFRAVEGIIVEGLKTVSKDQQRAFFSLHNSHGKSRGPFLGIAKTNVLPLGSDALQGGLFLEASRINHSCRHNAQSTWNVNLNQLTIHVFEDVEEGKEITISYLDGSKGYKTRQVVLKNKFGFNCECQLCSLPLDQRIQSDQRLDEITRLDDSIGDGMRITSTPIACLHDAYRLLQLLEDERVADARIPRLYYDALQIAIANGDQARAKTFAERAYAARVVLEGDDSPKSIRLKGFAERPADHNLYGTTTKWKQAVKKIPRELGEREFEDWLWRKKS
ncbi:uncharacterized protein BP5553_09304 [Venustampulla echinocandica]|uniref:SET domain-containing protein n=1 Tax=Venustampulla echinocandica TaxID=2656787 RepID=A0A370TCE0_9HELO|nr:uncharacterized protein BP5553_09304 [Venustampulla echinocandica]RDL31902.1 hypothetical protein BP5553_09304 [Venustampulla echinocandica]